MSNCQHIVTAVRTDGSEFCLNCDREWLAEENRMLEIAGRIADEACQEINKQAALRRKSGSTKPYAAQELLEEVIKILQERV